MAFSGRCLLGNQQQLVCHASMLKQYINTLPTLPQLSQKKNSPNKRNPIAMAFHRAACRQSIAHPHRLIVHHRIEHLGRQRIPFADQRPNVFTVIRIGSNTITAHHFAQRMRMRAICERIDGLRFGDRTRDLHMFDALRSDLSAGSQ